MSETSEPADQLELAPAPGEWQWPIPKRMFKHYRTPVACILWTLLLDGPFENDSGFAIKELRDALHARGGPYKALGGQPELYHVIERIIACNPGAIERRRKHGDNGRQSLCIYIATPLTAEQLPPDPFAEHAKSEPPVVRQTKVKPKPKPKPSSNGHGAAPAPALDPTDALMAIRAMADEALGHGLNAAEFATAERLAAALAENERLRADHEQTVTALLEKMRENESLRKALAGAARKGARR